MDRVLLRSSHTCRSASSLRRAFCTTRHPASRVQRSVAPVLSTRSAANPRTQLYRGYDGKLRIFRLLENCRRMADSATKTSMPSPEPEQLLELIKALCRVESPQWLPGDLSRGKYLYIRPTLIATDINLGCKFPREVLLHVVITHWPTAPESIPSPGAWKQPKGLKL